MASKVEICDWNSDLAGEWNALFSEASAGTPFQSHAWLFAWWRAFGRGKQARILTLREGKDLVGLMPMVRARFPWRTLRPMGCGPSDYLEPLARSNYETALHAELSGYLEDVRDVELIDLQQVRETHPLAAFGHPSEWSEQARCLVLDLPDNFESYRQSLGKSMRYEVDRLRKEPFLSGEAHIDTASTAEQATQYFEIFESLHRARWKKRGLPGAFFLPRLVAFQKSFLASAVQEGLVSLDVLWHEQKPVGAIYVLHGPRADYFYQSGFDPSAKSLSPGTTLVAHAIRRAIENGRQQFDFLRGAEDYKRRWKPQNEWRNLRFVRALNPFGAVAENWSNVASSVEQRVRRRFEGRGVMG